MYNVYQLSLRAESYEPRLTRLPYGKLTIVVGEDEEGNEVSYRAIAYGNTSRAPVSDSEYKNTNGQELVIHNPNGTQAMAINIMNQIKGYAYQPYSAKNALVPLEAELGDVVRIAGDQSVIATQDIYYDGITASDISAPGEDETDNEFSLYESKVQKAQVRSDKKLRASFIVELGRIEATLSEDYQKKEDMSDYVLVGSLNTSIGQYLDSSTGQAKIIAGASGTYQRQDQMGNYVLSSALNTSIGEYIDSQAGTAKIISAASGTYQTKDDMSEYAKSSTLNTSIEQYLDSNAGKAQIISAAAGTYQTKSDMSGYVKTSALNTSIGQYIDSSAGKAKIISAVSGTYQTISGMSSYVTKSSLDASITAYIDTQAGKAEITSAVSSTYQRKDAMGNYVAKNQLNNSIKQYVESDSGKNVIVASVSGSFAGKSYESRVEVSESKIGWLIASGDSASNFTMTERAIALTAGSIDLSGYVTFTSLSTKGSTSINGDNITTGTIKAELIEADKLKVNQLWYPYPGNFPIIYSDMVSGNYVLYLGTLTSSSYPRISTVRVSSSGVFEVCRYASGSTADGIIVDIANNQIRQRSNSNRYSIGSSTYPMANIAAQSWRLQSNTAGDRYGITVNVNSGTDGDPGYNLVPASNNALGLGSLNYRLSNIWTYSAMLCHSAGKLSFFGATASTKQTLSTSYANMGYTSATESNYLVILNNVVGILSKKYGMFAS